MRRCAAPFHRFRDFLHAFLNASASPSGHINHISIDGLDLLSRIPIGFCKTMKKIIKLVLEQVDAHLNGSEHVFYIVTNVTNQTGNLGHLRLFHHASL